MNTSYKQLKVFLVSEVRKFGPTFLESNSGKFLLFDYFFLDLDDFQDLNNFSDFLASFILLILISN